MSIRFQVSGVSVQMTGDPSSTDGLAAAAAGEISDLKPLLTPET